MRSPSGRAGLEFNAKRVSGFLDGERSGATSTSNAFDSIAVGHSVVRCNVLLGATRVVANSVLALPLGASVLGTVNFLYFQTLVPVPVVNL